MMDEIVEENVGGPVKADEVEEARRTEMFISHWLSRVQTAKQYWETRVFKRIRKNRLFHKGFQWEQTPDIIKKSLAEGKDDSRQVVNITQRYICLLYTSNRSPTRVAGPGIFWVLATRLNVSCARSGRPGCRASQQGRSRADGVLCREL